MMDRSSWGQFVRLTPELNVLLAAQKIQSLFLLFSCDLFSKNRGREGGVKMTTHDLVMNTAVFITLQLYGKSR